MSAPARRRVPPGLDSRGRRLWRDICALKPKMTGAEAVLAEEACRMADRLERLTDTLTGEPFVHMLRGDIDEEGVREFRLEVSGALGASRLMVLALSQVMTKLKLVDGAASDVMDEPTGDGGAGSAQTGAKGGDPIDEFSHARAARRGAAPTG